MLVYQLILNCSSSVYIDDSEKIRTFVKTLVERIDMIAHGAPVIDYLSYNSPTQGNRLYQATTNGSICGHFMELNGAVYLDVVSYDNFDIQKVIKVVVQYFDPLSYHINFLTRQSTDQKNDPIRII